MASSQSRRALLDNISCQPSSQRSSSPFRLFSAGRTIRASRRGTPQPPTMGRLSELRALFLFGGQPLPDRLRVGLEESGVVSWIVETLRVGFRIPFDLLYSSGLSLSAGVLASAHRDSRLNPGTSNPSSEGRNSLSVSGLLRQSLPHPEGFGVVAPHH